jgi:hypothetical protein
LLRCTDDDKKGFYCDNQKSFSYESLFLYKILVAKERKGKEIKGGDQKTVKKLTRIAL